MILLRKQCEENTKNLLYIEADVDQLQREVTSLKDKIRFMKKASKSKNLITHKIMDTTDINENLRAKICEILRDIDDSFNVDGIVAVTRIGKKVGNRPVLIQFIDYQCKSELFKYLGTIREKRLSISDNYTREERETRKSLIKHFPAVKDVQPAGH